MRYGAALKPVWHEQLSTTRLALAADGREFEVRVVGAEIVVHIGTGVQQHVASVPGI